MKQRISAAYSFQKPYSCEWSQEELVMKINLQRIGYRKVDEQQMRPKIRYKLVSFLVATV